MCTILLPIKPVYVKEILLGNKKYEYRKIKTKKKVNKIIIYSTSPVMKVVGEARVEDIIVDTPEKLWSMTSKESGTTKESFERYFKNKETAVAYKLGKTKIYPKPMSLEEIGITYVPQSFVYMD